MSILHPACLAIASLGFLFLLRDLKIYSKDPALILLSLVYLSSALSYVVAFPSVQLQVNSTLGIANIAVPLSQSCVMLVLVFQTSVIAHWALSPSQAWRCTKAFALGGACAILGLFATFARIPQDDFTRFYVHDAYYKAYLGIYICAYTSAQIYVAKMCWRQAQLATKAWITISLRIIMIGAAVTVGQSIIRTANLLADTFNFNVDHWLGIAWLCGDIGALLTLVGYFLPTLIDRARNIYSWANNHYAYKRLGPLWEALYAAAPSIAAIPPQSQLSALVRFHSISFLLYRRITEIRDGMIELRSYLSVDVRENAELRCAEQGIQDPDLAAAVTAEQISQALLSHANDRLSTVPAEYADTRLAARTADEDKCILLRIAAHFAAPVAQVQAGPHT